MTRKKEEVILEETADNGTVGTVDADEKVLLESLPEQMTEAEPKGPLIYLGPNLPGGRLLQSTVFRGGIPIYLQSLLDEKPDVAALIVPVDEIKGVEARIVQKGTSEYMAYQALLMGGTANG